MPETLPEYARQPEDERLAIMKPKTGNVSKVPGFWFWHAVCVAESHSALAHREPAITFM